jgi:hypothetical protein
MRLTTSATHGQYLSSTGNKAPVATGIGSAEQRTVQADPQAEENRENSMSKTSPQNFKNHGRFDPPYHMVLAAVLAVNLYMAGLYAYKNFNLFTAWLVILAIAVWIPVIKLRSYALKVQDRVIRLEERLRLQALAPAEWHAQIYKLSEGQLIGLRFASDDEVVALAKEALEQNLTRKQIKQRIKSWRADDFRV